MAGFRREPTVSRAGRKIAPTRKVQDILCESLCSGVDDAMKDLVQGERELRSLMAGCAPKEQVHEAYLSWMNIQSDVHRLLGEIEAYLPEEDFFIYRDRYSDLQRRFRTLEDAVADYQDRPIKVVSREMLDELRQQAQGLKTEIKAMEDELTRSFRVATPPAGLPVSSTPRDNGPPPGPVVTVPLSVTEQPTIVSTIAPVTVQAAAPNPPLLAIGPPPPSITATGPDSAAVALERLADILESKQTSGRLPRIEPDVFKGDLTTFPAWWNSFETMVESRASSDTERLFFLNKYTSGKANDCIKGFLGLYSDESAYRRARNVIQSRFGNRIKIAEAFKQRLSGWTKIRDADGPGLQAYADFLWQCNAAMDSLDYLSNLGCQEENRKMVAKLPQRAAERWARVIDDAVYGDVPDLTDEPSDLVGQFPSFSEFCRFVSREARVLMGSGQSTTKDAGRRATSLATEVSEEGDKKNQPPKCMLCSGPHYLYQCDTFMGRSVEFRKGYAREHALCFGCLRRNHVYRKCRIKNPDIMREHPEQGQTRAKAVNLCTSVSAPDGEFCTSIVSAWVFLDENAEHRVLVYVMLDSQSSGCFISDELAELLQLEPDEVSLQLTTLDRKSYVKAGMVEGLRVKAETGEFSVGLPRCYVRRSIPGRHEYIPRPELVARWPHLRDIADKLLPPRPDLSFGLLIGFNCSEAFRADEQRVGERQQPHARHTTLGWTVMGCLQAPARPSRSCTSLPTGVREINSREICRAFDQDFALGDAGDAKLSHDDARFLEILKQGIRQEADSHFQLPLPFRQEPHDLPDSRPMAMKRLTSIQRRMTRDPEFAQQYATFMEGLISSGQAELVPQPDSVAVGSRWYWCHHGVKHPRKPGKIRGVWDGSAMVRGVSINSLLLTGPDQTNNLVGVLCRFRREKVAVTCDIEGMFLQVRVDPAHRDYLRFLWFDGGDPGGDVREYRMAVNLFGAASSPGSSNLALKETANRFEHRHGKAAADFLRDDFYVDDGLGSTPDDESALALINSSRALCAEGGFNLHKFASSSGHVMEQIPPELRAKSLQQVHIQQEHLPNERALGLLMSLARDALLYAVTLLERPDTRRGYLSALSSVFDPLGLVAPALLPGRQLLQSLCTQKFGWDAGLPADVKRRWEAWYRGLLDLNRLEIPRCVRRTASADVERVELHVFADASTQGYGACCYLLLADADYRCDTSLVYAKARVAPTKPTTIPRMELQAAVLAVKMGVFLQTELRYDTLTSFFWTDSMVVLGYISNEARRFHVYVANRSRYIREHTQIDQWRHVDTAENPADLASRGTTGAELVDSRLWWEGPELIRQPRPASRGYVAVDPSDPEMRREEVAMETDVKEPGSVDRLIRRYSRWSRLLAVTACCHRFLSRLRRGPAGSLFDQLTDSIACREAARLSLIRYVQREVFATELRCLSRGEYPESVAEQRDRKVRLKKDSNLYRLDVYCCAAGLLRVGGRLRRSGWPEEMVHPVVLPGQHPLTSLLVRHYHEKVEHMGAVTTLNTLRQSGYWIIGGRVAIATMIRRCVGCRIRRGEVSEQKMAELPEDRFSTEPPFTYVAADLFGPFPIKQARSTVKWWICVFVCMASRAVHLEPVSSLDVSGFLQAYRRFVALRGPVRQLRCDRGTNFTGADNEQRKAWSEQEAAELERELQRRSCEFINFRFNYPKASHMAGAWERMIRTIRAAFWGTLRGHGSSVAFEVFNTLAAEAEALVNSRPLTVVDMGDDTVPPALTPAQLLTMKASTLAPPPGVFTSDDQYSRKRWRLTQFLAEQFWRRWVREYMLPLQTRPKWNEIRSNLQEDDIVLLVEPDVARSAWPLARVIAVSTSDDGLVRKVTVRTSTGQLQRPVQKTILIHRPEK